MDYPEWQKTIREAQVISDAEVAEAKRVEEDAEMKAKIVRGEQLVEVLKIFGIDAKNELNEVVVDEFIFGLEGGGLVGTFPNCRFNLSFSRNTHWTGNHEDYPYHDVWGSVNCFFPLNTNDNLTKIRAQLANELDRIEERFQQQHETWLKRQAKPVVTPPPSRYMNVDERFLSAFGDWLHEWHKLEHDLHDI